MCSAQLIYSSLLLLVMPSDNPSRVARSENKAKVVPLGPFPKMRLLIYGSSVGTNWGGLNERANLWKER